MIDFYLFGNHFNTETIVLMCVVWFIGLCVGWCFKRFNPFMIILCFFVFGQLITFILTINVWILNIPFFLGFMIHTYKPIFNKINQFR